MQNNSKTERERLTGFVESHVPSKHFGFIAGDDGKKYYFRFTDRDTARFKDGTSVTFEPTTTAKGYRAERVWYEKTVKTDQWQFPDHFIIRESRVGGDRLPPGYEILADPRLFVRSWGNGSREKKRENVMALAKSCGANAVIDAKWYKTEHSSGNYVYSIFHLIGRPVIIGRRVRKGESVPANAGEVMRQKMVAQNLADRDAVLKNRRRTLRNRWIRRVVIGAAFLGLGLHNEWRLPGIFNILAVVGPLFELGISLFCPVSKEPKYSYVATQPAADESPWVNDGPLE